MSRRVILVGDATDHGGKVISGSPKHSVDGRAIARKGDMVDCPQKYPGGKPHGVNAIVEGTPDYILDGIPVALEGHRSECGCVLIGSTNFKVG